MAGCAILAFGISLEVYANVLMVPGEGIVYAISKVLNKEFGVVKACFDVTLMLTAVTLSLIFFRGLNGIGEGTVISALVVGMIVRLYNRRLGFIWTRRGRDGLCAYIYRARTDIWTVTPVDRVKHLQLIAGYCRESSGIVAVHLPAGSFPAL